MFLYRVRRGSRNFLERWKILTEKSRFFGARSPSKLGAFRNFLGTVTKNGYFKILQREDPLGRQGVESSREGNVPPSPKSATVQSSGFMEGAEKMAKNM